MIEKKDFWKKYGFSAVMAGLFLAAFLLRFYRIGELPHILMADEAAIGYNAWCLANYGVDRYLNEMPIYASNFGGGQSPLYTYSLVLLLKLFPKVRMTLRLVRLPSLFFSMLVVVCGAKMLHMLFQNKRITLAGTVLLTFCPYFIQSGRFGWDCNLMLGCSVLAITLLIRYLQKPTWSALLLCGGGFVLVLYSYAVSYIALPIFLVVIALYMLYTKKLSVGRMFVWASEIVVLSLPIILFVLCLLLKLPGFHLMGIHILPAAVDRMADVTTKTTFWADFLGCIKFTLTNDGNMQDAVEKYYTMYVLSIPFIVVGFVWALAELVKSFKSRHFTYSAIFIFYALAVMIAAGWCGPAALHHANGVFVSYLYFCIVGIRQMLRFMHRYRKAFVSVLCAGYVFWIAVFLRYYFTMYTYTATLEDAGYPFYLYIFFRPEQEALDFMAEASAEKNIYIEYGFEEYAYFYDPVSPYEKKSNEYGGEEFCMTLDDKTPIEWNSAYMVTKMNQYFIKRFQSAGIPYEMTEYEYYYVFVTPEE